MIKNLRPTMVVVALFVSFVYTGIANADWQYFGLFGPYAYYYESGSAHRESDIGKVWVKYSVTNEEARKWVLNSRKEKGLATRGYEDYSASVALWIIKCSSKKWRVFKGSDFNSRGETLDSVVPSASDDWLPIVRGSSVDVLRMMICR